MYLVFMKNFLYLFLIFFFISNCTLNKSLSHHGVKFLDKKNKKLLIEKTNKNDIIKILGPPSTKSKFDEDLWIYIERTTSTSRITKLGKKVLLINNVLILEIDSNGLLKEKIFLNKEDMKEIKFSEVITVLNTKKKSFVYNFLSSMRKKMNDPLNKKKNN
jgi:outer membrane protein assembly factor BamE (lipoprotein component of BamABCDE complex)